MKSASTCLMFSLAGVRLLLLLLLLLTFSSSGTHTQVHALSCTSLGNASSCYTARQQQLSVGDSLLCNSTIDIGSLSALNTAGGTSGLGGTAVTYVNTADVFTSAGFVKRLIVEFFTGGGTGSVTLLNVQGSAPYYKRVLNAPTYTFTDLTVPSSGLKQLNLTIPDGAMPVVANSMLGLYVSSGLGAVRLRATAPTGRLYAYTSGLLPVTSWAMALTHLNTAANTQLTMQVTQQIASPTAPAACFGTFCRWSGSACLSGAATTCAEYSGDSTGCAVNMLNKNCTFSNGVCVDVCSDIAPLACLQPSSTCQLEYSYAQPLCVGGASTRPSTQSACSAAYGFWDPYISAGGYCFSNIAQSRALRNCTHWNTLSPISTAYAACVHHGCMSIDNVCMDASYVNNPSTQIATNAGLAAFSTRNITFYDSSVTLTSTGPRLTFKVLVPLACTPHTPSFEGLAIGSFNPVSAVDYGTTADTCVSSNFTNMLPDAHPELVGECSTLVAQVRTICQNTGTLNFEAYPKLRQLYGDIKVSGSVSSSSSSDASLLSQCELSASTPDAIVLVVSKDLNQWVERCPFSGQRFVSGPQSGQSAYDLSVSWFARIYDAGISPAQFIVASKMMYFRVEQMTQTSFLLTSSVRSQFKTIYTGYLDLLSTSGNTGAIDTYQRELFFTLVYSTSSADYVIGPRSSADITVLSNSTCYGNTVTTLVPESSFCTDTECRSRLVLRTAPRQCAGANAQSCFATCSGNATSLDTAMDGMHIFTVRSYVCPAPFGSNAQSCTYLYAPDFNMVDRVAVSVTDPFNGPNTGSAIIAPAMNLTFGLVGESFTVQAMTGSANTEVALPTRNYSAQSTPGFYVQLTDVSLRSTWVLNIINITIQPLDLLTLQPVGQELTYSQLKPMAIWYPRRVRIQQACMISVCQTAPECLTHLGCDSYGLAMNALVQHTSSSAYQWRITIEVLNPALGVSFFNVLSVNSALPEIRPQSSGSRMSLMSATSNQIGIYESIQYESIESTPDMQSNVGWIITYANNENVGMGHDNNPPSNDTDNSMNIDTIVIIVLSTVCGSIFLFILCCWFLFMDREPDYKHCDSDAATCEMSDF